MDKSLIQILEHLGFNKKEAHVYLATTELGLATASEIAKHAKVNRVTAYDILEKLKKRKFVNYIIKRRIKHFSALKPDDLFNEFQKRTENLKNALPEFQKISKKQDEKNKIEYYEGEKDFKTIEQKIAKNEKGLHLGSTFHIFKDQVIILSNKENSAIIINNSQVAEDLQNIYQASNNREHKTKLLKPLAESELAKTLNSEPKTEKNLSLF